MACITGELEIGCLATVTKRFRPRGPRETKVGMFLGHGVVVFQTDTEPVLRFLMPDGTIHEIPEELFDTTAHIFVEVIQELE